MKVRIAPSPSGYLHVGTARTAIFNWLYAKRIGGKFVIRIEDTDTERSDASLVQPIIDALKWLGIESDEPIVYQSQRDELHRNYVLKLLDSGRGYRCFCTKETLEEQRQAATREKRAPMYDRRCGHLNVAEVAANLSAGMPFAVRLHIPPGSTTYHDLILGDITRENTEIEDLVVARSDGRALYNFAVVVDDHEMGITDIIRGNDHITNTFKQIHIYQALSLPVPRFGHVPLLLRPDKQKVSKRLGDKDVAEYGHEGILPEAMFNYLCLLGWSPKDGREIMSRAELIEAFSIAGVNANNPVFDEQKLISFNKEYIRGMPFQVLGEHVLSNLKIAGLFEKWNLDDPKRKELFSGALEILRERLERVNDFAKLAKCYFEPIPPQSFDEEAVDKRINSQTPKYMTEYAKNLVAMNPGLHTKEEYESVLLHTAASLNIKPAELIHPARLAISGVGQGPGLYEMMKLFPASEVHNRVVTATQWWQSPENKRNKAAKE